MNLGSEREARVQVRELQGRIEGLHDAVRNYTRTILPGSLASFLYGAVWWKQQNLLFLLIYFIARFEISTECVF